MLLPQKRRHTRRLHIESLESRRLLATFAVTSPLDDGSAGTLREAIVRANQTVNTDLDGDGTLDPDAIVFDMFPNGSKTILVKSALPQIIDPVIINGYTQGDAHPNTLGVLNFPDDIVNPLRRSVGEGAQGTNALFRVRIDGRIAGAADGLVVRSGGSLITGLTIGNFNGAAIRLMEGGDNIIQGNFLGINSSGSGATANVHGIVIEDGSGNNLIGGTVPSARNLISGNTGHGIRLEGDDAVTGNRIEGNLIGTDASGTEAIGNGFGISIENVPGNIIGGEHPFAGNLISGQEQSGISVRNGGAEKTIIHGNFIGTDISGTVDVGNKGRGIFINAAPLTIIGASGDFTGNLISGNDSNGIEIIDAISTSVPSLTQILGNRIGTSADGTTALPNGRSGIQLNGAVNTFIGSVIEGAENVISGNSSHGVNIANSPGTRLYGNLIGTDSTGKSVVPNGGNGVRIESTQIIVGGHEEDTGNVIAGNDDFGIELRKTDNTIQGNWIGTDRTGTVALGNSLAGIILSASGNLIGGEQAGAGNVIAHNMGDGVFVNANVVDNSILGNSIYANGGLGIDLTLDGVNANDAGDADSGSNKLQNFPVLTSAVSAGQLTVEGMLNSEPEKEYRVEFFASPEADPSGFGQGMRYLGAADITTNADSTAAISVTLPLYVPPGEVITSTATDPDGNTSEFSEAVTVTGDATTDVFWISQTDGFWDEGSNWDTGIPPQPGQNAIIDVASEVTVTYRSENVNIERLVSTETLILSSGTLAIHHSANVTNLEIDPDALLKYFGQPQNTFTLDSGVLDNRGKFELVDGAGFVLDGGAALINHPSALVQASVSSDGEPETTIVIRNNSRLENQADGSLLFGDRTNISLDNAALVNMGMLGIFGGGWISMTGNAVMENSATGAFRQMNVGCEPGTHPDCGCIPKVTCRDLMVELRDNSRLINRGTIEVSRQGSTTISGTATLHNHATGVMRVLPGPTKLGPEHALTINAGQLLNEGTVEFGGPVDMTVTDGTVRNSGHISFNGGGLSLSGDALLEVLSGARIHTSYTHRGIVLDDTSRVENSGTVELTSAAGVSLAGDSKWTNKNGASLLVEPAIEQIVPQTAIAVIGNGEMVNDETGRRSVECAKFR